MLIVVLRDFEQLEGMAENVLRLEKIWCFSIGGRLREGVAFKGSTVVK